MAFSTQPRQFLEATQLLLPQSYHLCRAISYRVRHTITPKDLDRREMLDVPKFANDLFVPAHRDHPLSLKELTVDMAFDFFGIHKTRQFVQKALGNSLIPLRKLSI
jgi:hypothetical protein